MNINVSRSKKDKIWNNVSEKLNGTYNIGVVFFWYLKGGILNITQ